MSRPRHARRRRRRSSHLAFGLHGRTGRHLRSGCAVRLRPTDRMHSCWITIGYGSARFVQSFWPLERVGFDLAGVRGHGCLCFWRDQLRTGRIGLGIRNDVGWLAVGGLTSPLWLRRRVVGDCGWHAFGLKHLRRVWCGGCGTLALRHYDLSRGSLRRRSLALPVLFRSLGPTSHEEAAEPRHDVGDPRPHVPHCHRSGWFTLVSTP